MGPNGKKVAFLFPGSGSQHLGMGLELYERVPLVRKNLDALTNALGYDLTEYMFRGSEEILFPPANSPQLTIFIEVTLALSLTVANSLREEGVFPDFAAGRSMGEYSAYSFCGVFDAPLCFLLARSYILYGQPECLAEPGILVTIYGLDSEEMKELCSELEAEGEFCELVTFYDKARLGTIGLRKSSLDKLMGKLSRFRHKAVVSKEIGAFHTKLFDTAMKKITPLFSAVNFNPSMLPICCNYTAGNSRDPASLKENLLKALTSPVKWQESIETLLSEGVEIFVEMAPGAMLTEFICDLPRGTQVLRTDTAANYARTLEVLKKAGKRQ